MSYTKQVQFPSPFKDSKELVSTKNPNLEFLEINTFRFEDELQEKLMQLNGKGYKSKKIYQGMLEFLNEYGFKFNIDKILNQCDFS